MDKTYDRNEKRSSEKLIDRILSRFRMVKRGSQSTITWGLGNTSSNTSTTMDNQRANDSDANDSRSQCSLEEDDTIQRRVSLSDVLPFCDQLEKFIKYIRSVRDLNYLTYEYPNVLQNRLDTNAHELESMLVEVKDALVNIEQLKMQRKLIKKEKVTVKKTLKRMRDDEVRELECIISLYDKAMFARWENVKTTHKSEVLEGMLSDIKGKQMALENLSTLVTRKLGQLQVFLPLIGSDTEKEPGKGRTVIPLPFPSFCAIPNDDEPPKIPPPPPMPPVSPLPPPPATMSHLPKRTHTQRLSIQRRRRLERREENLERRCIVTANIEDLPLVPLNLSDLSHNLVSNLYPTILSTISNSNHDVVSANSTSSTVVRNGSNDIPSSNNNNNNGPRSGLGTEFQSEMRTVLQALFGDLRTGPTLLVTESSSSNATAENVENMNREIELYTLRRPQ